MKILWTEVVKFIKNNVIKVLIGAIIGAVAIVGFSYLNKDTTIETLQDMETGKFKTSAMPAQFKFYIEDSQENPFSNNLLLEEHFTLPQLLEQASEETNTNLSELVTTTGNRASVNYVPSGETNVLGVTRNSSTQIFDFYVNVGDESNNLKIAEYYFNYLTEDNVPFLEGKNLYVFREPIIIEVDDQQLLDSPSVNANGINPIVQGVIGSIFGAVATVFLLLFMTLFSKKLVYSFSYFIPENNYLVLMNNKSDEKEQLELLLKAPNTGEKVAIIESSSRETTTPLFNQNLEDIENLSVVNNVLEIGNLDAVDRLILIIEEGQTTRKWYNTQRVLGEKFETPIYIVQINK